MPAVLGVFHLVFIGLGSGAVQSPRATSARRATARGWEMAANSPFCVIFARFAAKEARFFDRC